MSAAWAWGVPWVAALRGRAAARPPRLPVVVALRGDVHPAGGWGASVSIESPDEPRRAGAPAAAGPEGVAQGSIVGHDEDRPGRRGPAGPADAFQLVDEHLVRAPHPGEANGHAAGERPLDAALGRPVEHKLDGDPRHRGPKSCDEAGLRRPPPPPAE